MMRVNVLIVMLAISLAMISVHSGLAAESSRPNIIVIVADDLGYGDLGVHGCKDIPTPNLDSLARGGVRCTNGYVSHPYCSPTRAGLLTGRYQQRFGHEFNPGPPTHAAPDVGLPLSETTMADRLRKAGYRTGIVGKWHLGHADEKYHPLNRGFDEFFGFLGGAHSYLESGRGANSIYRNRKQIQEKEYLTDAFAREGAAFIERNADKPFFLYWAFNAVHGPLEAPPSDAERFEVEIPTITVETNWPGASPQEVEQEIVVEQEEQLKSVEGITKLTSESMDSRSMITMEFAVGTDMAEALLKVNSRLQQVPEYPKEADEPVAEISDPKRRIYAAMLTSMDNAIGRGMKALRDKGLEENTLIFFISDNGGPENVNGSNNGPFRGNKGDTFEGGIRSPFFVQWKGHLPTGETYEQPVIQLDILPTALAAAGVDASADAKFDGVDLLPYLAGEMNGAPHDTLYWRDGSDMAVRSGDWKLVHSPNVRPNRRDRSNAASGKSDLHEAQLFNLKDDPGEQTNLAASHPEKRDHLAEAWTAWSSELAEPLWQPPVRVKKRVRNG